MILALFILEVLLGIAAIILYATNNDWESMLCIALSAVCVVVARMI